MRSVAFYLILSIGAVASPLAAETAQPRAYADGLAAYQRKDYATAAQIWLPLAEAGNSDAQHFVGHLYFEGNAVRKDGGLALKWWRLAAENGNADAQFDMGLVYEKGEGVSKDLTEAKSWYAKAARAGNLGGKQGLGRLTAPTGGPSAYVARAPRWVALDDWDWVDVDGVVRHEGLNYYLRAVGMRAKKSPTEAGAYMMPSDLRRAVNCESGDHWTFRSRDDPSRPPPPYGWVRDTDEMKSVQRLNSIIRVVCER